MWNHGLFVWRSNCRWGMQGTLQRVGWVVCGMLDCVEEHSHLLFAAANKKKNKKLTPQWVLPKRQCAGTREPRRARHDYSVRQGRGKVRQWIRGRLN